MVERYTEGAKRALSVAQEKAIEWKHNYVGTEHLLIGLVGEAKSVSARALHELGITSKALEEKILALVGKGNSSGNQLQMTPRTKHVLSLALQAANSRGNHYIGTEHILLGLLQDGGGVAIQILRNEGIQAQDVVKKVNAIIGEEGTSGNSSSHNAGNAASDLGEIGDYAIDLNEKARQGTIDPVIGRDTEIQRVIQILSRRTKNNPVLIGEPGVGKTAIAEGLAQRIVSGDVPHILKDKRIISLSLSSMLAGAKYRGEFEERLQKVMDEVTAHEDMIIFIDEMHTLIGAGATEGAMDAANILKPALSRGNFQVIGATTLDEYKKHIEKDAALERRFQPVLVGEPNEEDALQILKGLRDRYEAFHKVQITDEALQAAVHLSSRYISDRFLPDKAIDVMDEAASKVRMSVFSAAPDVKDLERSLGEVQKEKEAAITAQNFEEAAVLRDKEKSLQEELASKQEAAKKESEEKLVVTEKEISAVVSEWTGIPVSKVGEEESSRLLRLEEELHEHVIGQDEAVVAVAKAVRRARAGLKDPKRPIGSFLFLGPTGVGKTELARTLAANLFGDEQAMTRIDMSEYMEKHAVSRLVGSPPGYVGYDEGGQLTEAVRRRPYSVILFDEVEKAHPDFFNILLQVLDDGRLTDNQGRTVDFKNTVIIMTSNLGSKFLQDMDSAAMGFLAHKGGDKSEKAQEAAKKEVLQAVKQHFRPEFLNRIDDMIVFKPLEEEQLEKIVTILLKDVTLRLQEQGMELEISKEAMQHIIQEGTDVTMGARPLKRAIQRLVEDPISDAILEGRATSGSLLHIVFTDNGIEVNIK